MSLHHGISLRGVAVAYRRAPALEDLSGVIAEGSMTAVVGPNGAGKSTLLKTLAGELAPDGGSVDLGGLSPRAIAYLPQLAEIDRRFPLTVEDAALLGLWHETGAFGRVSAPQRERVRAALATVGLDGLQARQIGTLSTGQFQRVMFARLLLREAAVLLLDEPFAAVDERTTEDLLTLIGSWHRAGRTIVAVLHDLAQVRRHFPCTLLLARRPVAWGATSDVLSPPNLARARALAGGWENGATAALSEGCA